MDYNEQQAVAFILAGLPADRAALYSEDEILNVIDIIWDYYEDSGLLDPATALEDDLDIDPEEAERRELEQLTRHVAKQLRADKDSPIAAEDIPLIISREIEYENSLL